jgi:hypothetical protein
MNPKSTIISDVKRIELNRITDHNGSISVVQNSLDIPFDVKRIYYLYDIPSGSERGGHAHKFLQQLIIAASGSFDIILDDGKQKTTINLNRPNIGLLLPPGLWRELNNFSSGSICLVLASHEYDEQDYLRDYNEFLVFKAIFNAK